MLDLGIKMFFHDFVVLAIFPYLHDDTVRQELLRKSRLYPTPDAGWQEPNGRGE